MPLTFSLQIYSELTAYYTRAHSIPLYSTIENVTDIDFLNFSIFRQSKLELIILVNDLQTYMVTKTNKCTQVDENTVKLGYNVIKGTECFVSL
jgi:hypothetical protein